MRRLTFLAALALSLFALSGCATQAVAPTSTPTPTEDSAASIQQWASAIAQAEASLDEWTASWEESGCSVLNLDNFACNATMTSGGFVAQTVYAQVAIPSTSTSNAYLGDPPAEIASLYGRTLDAASALNDAGAAWVGGSCAKPDDKCTSLALEMDRAMTTMTNQMAAWEPYL